MASKRILIVEDESIVAEQIRQNLKTQGYEIVGIAGSGEQAVMQGRQTRPDLVVMDIVLSGTMDGISAAQELRPLGIPVVYLTAYADQHLQERAQGTEPLAYLTKPFRSGELAAVIQRALFQQGRETSKESESPSQSSYIHEQFQLMMEKVTDHAIFTLDTNGNVNSWNGGAERINGYSAEEILGQSYAVLFTPEDRRRHVPEDELDMARRNGSADNTRWLMRRNGESYWAEGSLTAIHNSGGALTGFVKITRDMTERRQMQEALRKSQEQLRIALHAARTGTWNWNIQANTESFDESLRALFGLRPDQEPKTIEEFYALIHPDDRGNVIAAFERTRREGIHLDTEFRVPQPDGTERWLMDQGEVILDDEKRPLRMVGACVDITERKQAEEALRVSEERFRLFINNVRDYALIQMDREGRMVSWNPGAERMLGYTEREIIGCSGVMLFTPEDAVGGEHDRELRRAANTGRSDDERWHVRKDGTRFWCRGVVSAMYDTSGQLRGFAKIMRDETERRLANEKLTTSLTEKEALLKEIHHRVKNNLQVITSLLSLQSETLHNESIRANFEEACNRVNSIAEIHEMLYRAPDLARVDFAVYLERLGQNLLSFYGVDRDHIRLSISASNAKMEVAEAIPCGLIMNELLTNSLKHAFPGGRRGHIQIAVNCGREECVLAVNDNGVGLPTGFNPEGTTSLGLKLVSVLVKQLRGKVRFEPSEEGTRAVIRFPHFTEGTALKA